MIRCFSIFFFFLFLIFFVIEWPCNWCKRRAFLFFRSFQLALSWFWHILNLIEEKAFRYVFPLDNLTWIPIKFNFIQFKLKYHLPDGNRCTFIMLYLSSILSPFQLESLMLLCLTIVWCECEVKTKTYERTWLEESLLKSILFVISLMCIVAQACAEENRWVGSLSQC